MTILDEAIQHVEHLLENFSILPQEGSEAAADTREQLAPVAELQTKDVKVIKAGKGSKPSVPAAGTQSSDDFGKANLQVRES